MKRSFNDVRILNWHQMEKETSKSKWSIFAWLAARLVKRCPRSKRKPCQNEVYRPPFVFCFFFNIFSSFIHRLYFYFFPFRTRNADEDDSTQGGVSRHEPQIRNVFYFLLRMVSSFSCVCVCVCVCWYRLQCPNNEKKRDSRRTLDYRGLRAPILRVSIPNRMSFLKLLLSI